MAHTATLRRANHYLYLAGASFVATTIVCMLLRSDAIFSHYGLSYYGNFAATIIPYGLGLATTAYFLLRASSTLSVHQELKSLRYGIEVIAIALIGIVATPSFSGATLVRDLHIFLGFSIFIVQGILIGHYLMKGRADRVDRWLAALQFAATVCALLSFDGKILHLMLISQTLAILAFGAIVLRAVQRAVASD